MKTSSPDVAAELADFVHALRFERLAPALVDHAVKIIHDSLGCIIAGTTLPEIAGLHKLAKPGAHGATVIGSSLRADAAFAALVNGAAGISLELDEGNQFCFNHPTMHILPAALAVAEELDKSGADLLTAFIAGYEVAARVGRATHLRDPVHPFGTHAIVGAAAAVAKLMNLDRETIAAAMRIAAGLTIASSQTAANAGASVRNAVTGLTNANGIVAAKLAKAGFSGEPEAFAAVYGKVLGDAFDPSHITDGLGEDYLLQRNYFKVHACSRWNHAPIEAAAAALHGRTLKFPDIADVAVWTFNPATRLHWPAPVNGFAAKHSIPYNVAVRILKGDNGIGAYAEGMVADPDVRALAAKITLREDPNFTARLPNVRAARVDITLTNGEVKTATVERAPGGFDNPFPAGVLDVKFRSLAGLVFSPDKVEDLDRAVWGLPAMSRVTELTSLLLA